jgi:hypothetical protein
MSHRVLRTDSSEVKGISAHGTKYNRKKKPDLQLISPDIYTEEHT